MTPETRAKMSAAATQRHRDHPISLETRARIGAAVSVALRGKPKTHGLSGRDGRASRVYLAWKDASNRCNNPNNSRYHAYGARGIEMRLTPPEWYDELGDKPAWAIGGVDRIDPYGNYERGNIRWATRSEQRRNRRDKQPQT